MEAPRLDMTTRLSQAESGSLVPFGRNVLDSRLKDDHQDKGGWNVADIGGLIVCYRDSRLLFTASQ